MFLFFDVRQFRKQLDFYQAMNCQYCGRFGRYEVFESGNQFRLFFIPVFMFGKKYLVRTTCCDTWYYLSAPKGKAIARGETIKINESDLEIYRPGAPATGNCPNCGKPYDIGANFCPHCGQTLT